MRLIDANKLEYTNTGYIAKWKVDMQPTIEPKRGEWTHELGEDFRTCSNCKISMGMDFYEILERFNYCPHCGADMRTEAQHE